MREKNFQLTGISGGATVTGDDCSAGAISNNESWIRIVNDGTGTAICVSETLYNPLSNVAHASSLQSFFCELCEAVEELCLASSAHLKNSKPGMFSHAQCEVIGTHANARTTIKI